MSASLAAFELPRVRERLQRFLADQSLEDVEITDLRRFTVGFSWITFGFTGAWRERGTRVGRKLILRIGPPIGIFAPYKASPEFRTLRALVGSGVPVPAVHWFSDEVEAFGAPFFICDFIAGEAPIPWTHDGGPAFDEPTRRELSEQFVSALAALHRFQWNGTEVAGIGGSTDVRRTAMQQVETWRANLARWSRSREPMLEWAAIWLRDHAPVAPRISVVHGDFRIGNFLVEAGRITAILDWELVQLGDPVEDLGSICMQAWRGRSPYMCHLFEREQLLERYNALTGFHGRWARGQILGGVRNIQARSDALWRTALFRSARLQRHAHGGHERANPANAATSGNGDGEGGVNIALERLFEGMAPTLRTDVIPRVDDAYARGQAVGLIDLIDSIAPRVEWARAPLLKSVNEKRRLLLAVAEALDEAIVAHAGAPELMNSTELESNKRGSTRPSVTRCRPRTRAPPRTPPRSKR